MWQEAFHKEIKGLEEKTLETFVQYLILNDDARTIRIKQYCELLQIDYHSMYFCIVIDIGDVLIEKLKYEQKTFTISKNTIIHRVKEAFNSNEKDICTFLNTEKIVILKSVSSNEEYFQMMTQITHMGIKLQRSLATYQIFNIKIAAGNLSEAIQHMNTSYDGAEWLMLNGEAINIESRIFNYYDWDVLLALLPKQFNQKLTNKIYDRLKLLFENEAFDQLKKDFIA